MIDIAARFDKPYTTVNFNPYKPANMAITPLVLSGTADYDIPSLVTIHPVAVASILDHHLRRPREADGKEQDRVIGTLMGTRSEVRLALSHDCLSELQQGWTGLGYRTAKSGC